MNKQHSIFIADDDARMREWIGRLVSKDASFRIMGEAGDGNEALEKIRLNKPDLAVMDIRMPGLNGLVISRHIKDLGLPTKVVILTMFDLPEYRREAFDCGVSEYLLKENMVSELIPAINGVLRRRDAGKKSCSVLIVDDDVFMARTLADILKSQGFEARAVNHASDALELVENTPFDCILSDIKMPGMSGIELHEKISSKMPDVPVLLMTAYSEERSVSDAVKRGVVQVLTKPVEIPRFIGFLTNLRTAREPSLEEMRMWLTNQVAVNNQEL